ncbi:MAG: hypothetical protein HY906_08160 [Deltaproteobacteria bacterium]|nr:hypothetical protein [Deltaproteobacteria bacterium]
MMRQHLGYTEEELALFKRHPRNARVMAVAPDMKSKTIVFEVVASEGCNSHHTVGTRFYFTGDGNLITKMAPARVCAFALPMMTQAVFAIHELWYAGVDPIDLAFKRGGCFDVGVRCGGWGNIVLEARMMDRQEAAALHASSSGSAPGRPT